MVEITTTGSQVITEGSGLLSAKYKNQTAEDANGLVIAKAFTVGDAWAVPLRMMVEPGGANASAGLILADGVTATDNVVIGHLQKTTSQLLVGRHGTWTDMSTAPWVSTDIATWAFPWIWLKITYQATNTFRFEVSPDGLSWTTWGESDITQVMTPTHVGVFWSSTEATDQIATFGPLRLVDEGSG
jgi:hypothetical protein